jgi:hypothetical protein
MTKIATSQRQEVADLCLAGKSVASVAAEYGVTAPRIYTIFKILGIPLPRREAAERDSRAPTARDLEMAAMHKGGSTLLEIGEKFGLTRERIRQILSRKLGITKHEGGCAVRSFRNTSAKVAALRAKDERKAARCSALWGMSLDGYESHVGEFGSCGVTSSPMHKYTSQRANARKRGIAWNFTFADWWRVWQESGKWDERALSKTGYVMARWGDGDAPYSVDTVYICTQSQNAKDSYIVSPSAERSAKARITRANNATRSNP